MIKERVFKAIKCVCFLIVFGLLFVTVQDILKADYTSKMVEGIYELEEDSVQAVFLGTSHMYCAISPEEIYEHNGIVTYNCATAAQNISSSYYLLQQILKTQTPKVVVLDAGALYFEEATKRQRFVLNILKSSANKVHMTDYYLKCLEEEGKEGTDVEEFVGTMLPIYSYHQRWKELDEEDFIETFNPSYYTKGYLFRNNYRKYSYSVERMDKNAKKNESFRLEILDINKEYLRKIRDLCQDKGIKLLLTKVPAVGKPDYRGAYPRYKYELTSELCKEYGIDYFDLVYSEGADVGLDLRYDFYDKNHLNFSGAVKASDFMGDYLVKTYGLERTSNKMYEDDLETYNKVKYITEFSMTYDFKEYLGKLKEYSGNSVVIMAGQGEGLASLTEEERNQLSDIGVKNNLTELNGNSYICVIDGGKVVHEKTGSETLSYRYRLGELDIKVESQGAAAGSTSAFMNYERNYSCGVPGINILVIDKTSGLIIDSVTYGPDPDPEEGQEPLNVFNHIDDVTENEFFEAYEGFILKQLRDER